MRLFYKTKIKLLKYIVKAFPANKIRLLAMKACGYSVGEKVYIGPELFISTSSDNKTAKIYLGKFHGWEVSNRHLGCVFPNFEV